MSAKPSRAFYLWNDCGGVNVTVRNAPAGVRESLSRVRGSRVLERTQRLIRCVIPASSLDDLSDLCQTSDIPLQAMGPAVAVPTVSRPPEKLPDPAKKMGRFSHADGRWDFRFDK